MGNLSKRILISSVDNFAVLVSFGLSEWMRFQTLTLEERFNPDPQVIQRLLEQAPQMFPTVPRGLCPFEPVRVGGFGLQSAGTLQKKNASPRAT